MFPSNNGCIFFSSFAVMCGSFITSLLTRLSVVLHVFIGLPDVLHVGTKFSDSSCKVAVRSHIVLSSHPVLLAISLGVTFSVFQARIHALSSLDMMIKPILAPMNKKYRHTDVMGKISDSPMENGTSLYLLGSTARTDGRPKSPARTLQLLDAYNITKRSVVQCCSNTRLISTNQRPVIVLSSQIYLQILYLNLLQHNLVSGMML